MKHEPERYRKQRDSHDDEDDHPARAPIQFIVRYQRNIYPVRNAGFRGKPVARYNLAVVIHLFTASITRAPRRRASSTARKAFA
ncbi:hypothetical protein ACFSHP_03240 [Novosphingobium panipatense]